MSQELKKPLRLKTEIQRFSNPLPVMEMFYTLQGEGAYSGEAAYFVRLSGCDVGCVWCDVKESWSQDDSSLKNVNDIVEDAKQYSARIVVITGGEPLMHDLQPLTQAFSDAGFSVHIETSGAHSVTGKFDWFCLSPKKFKPALSEAFAMADELKVVIYHRSDFEWAKAQAQHVSNFCRLSLQPEWSRQTDLIPEIVAFVKENPRWKVSLQTHKYLQIP